MTRTLSGRIVAWQRQYGRHDLPWQNTRDPYAIWLSEIMLQQTQVSAVIPYYERFLGRLPTLAALARAESDVVLELWSGLGYYSRARNLHRAARVIVDDRGGAFPDERSAIEALPGIGRSTAAAIAAFAFGRREAILDGNVKRVFARHFGIDGFPGDARIEGMLWSIAERELPEASIELYTQGLMDLGATVCTRARPACERCPVAGSCVALRDGRVDALPARRPKKARPERRTMMLVMLSDGQVLLEKRPEAGIWGGLWSFPEVDCTTEALKVCATRFGGDPVRMAHLPLVRHGFTHFALDIEPLVVHVAIRSKAVHEPHVAWLDTRAAAKAAIPVPVRKILGMLLADQSALLEEVVQDEQALDAPFQIKQALLDP